MKIKFSLLVLVYLFAGMIVQAQEVDITGTWAMYEMTWATGSDVTTTTEDQLKDEGMMSEYDFLPEGKLKLVSNMTGSGNMENIEGSWKLEGDKLTCTFDMGGTLRDIVWEFEYRDEAMHLTRTSPDGATSVVNSFKRK